MQEAIDTLFGRLRVTESFLKGSPITLTHKKVIVLFMLDAVRAESVRQRMHTIQVVTLLPTALPV